MVKLDNITIIDNFFAEEDFAKVFELSKKMIRCADTSAHFVWDAPLYPICLGKIKEITSLKPVHPFQTSCYIRHAPKHYGPAGYLHHDLNNSGLGSYPYTFILYIEVDEVGEQQELIFPYYNSDKELVSNEFTEICCDLYENGKYILPDTMGDMKLELLRRKDEFFKVSPKNNRAIFWKNNPQSSHCPDLSGELGFRRNIVVSLTE